MFGSQGSTATPRESGRLGSREFSAATAAQASLPVHFGALGVLQAPSVPPYAAQAFVWFPLLNPVFPDSVPGHPVLEGTVIEWVAAVPTGKGLGLPSHLAGRLPEAGGLCSSTTYVRPERDTRPRISPLPTLPFTNDGTQS